LAPSIEISHKEKKEGDAWSKEIIQCTQRTIKLETLNLINVIPLQDCSIRYSTIHNF